MSKVNHFLYKNASEVTGEEITIPHFFFFKRSLQPKLQVCFQTNDRTFVD